jgi:hypothetical protein
MHQFVLTSRSVSCLLLTVGTRFVHQDDGLGLPSSLARVGFGQNGVEQETGNALTKTRETSRRTLDAHLVERLGTKAALLVTRYASRR